MGLWGKSEGSRMLIIDEKAIEKTHHPDTKKHDVSPLHRLINEILMPSTTTTTVEEKRLKTGSSTQNPMGQGQVDGDNLTNFLVKCYKELKEDFLKPESQPKPAFRNIPPRFKEWAEIVPQISIKLWDKCSGGGGWDVNKITMEVFKLLSCYSWEVKIFVTLAAFALVYKDSSSKAKNIEHIQYLIDAMVQLINTIFNFNVNDARPKNFSSDIQTPVSWTVGSIVVCTSHIRYIEDELSELTKKVVELRYGWLRNASTRKYSEYLEILEEHMPHKTSTPEDTENVEDLNPLLGKRKR